MKNKKILKRLIPLLFIAAFVLIWEAICLLKLVPRNMLPSPVDVAKAFSKDFKLLFGHTLYTLAEALSGLVCGIIVGFLMAVIMDRFDFFHMGFRPLLVVSQTIPTIAIAPLFSLWLGYGMAPKIFLVTLTTFFPIAVGLCDGYRSTDIDQINLLRSMGANKFKIFRFVKFPSALPNFFSALKISVTYSIVGAVISEWVGGVKGLGVYMIRVKNSYSYDKMFAAIFLVVALSLLLMLITDILRKALIPSERKTAEK